MFPTYFLLLTKRSNVPLNGNYFVSYSWKKNFHETRSGFYLIPRILSEFFEPKILRSSISLHLPIYMYLRSLLLKCDCLRNYENLRLINICAITVLLSVISGGCSGNDSEESSGGHTVLLLQKVLSHGLRLPGASKAAVFLGWFLLTRRGKLSKISKGCPEQLPRKLDYWLHVAMSTPVRYIHAQEDAYVYG